MLKIKIYLSLLAFFELWLDSVVSAKCTKVNNGNCIINYVYARLCEPCADITLTVPGRLI